MTVHQTAMKPSRRSTAARTDGAPTDELGFEASPDEVLGLLGDAYTQRILREVVDQPRSAGEITARTDISKVTTYRRLNRLEEVGLVESHTVVCPDGYHHAAYRATVTDVVIRLTGDGLDVTVRRRSPEDADGTHERSGGPD